MNPKPVEYAFTEEIKNKDCKIGHQVRIIFFLPLNFSPLIKFLVKCKRGDWGSVRGWSVDAMIVKRGRWGGVAPEASPLKTPLVLLALYAFLPA